MYKMRIPGSAQRAGEVEHLASRRHSEKQRERRREKQRRRRSEKQRKRGSEYSVAPVGIR